MPHVEAGIQKGIQAGVSRITTELTAGGLAQEFAMPEGMPTHIGTPGTMPPPQQPGQSGQQQPATNNPRMDLGQRAAQAQGNRPKNLVGGGMAPTTTLTGNQPGKGALPISPGIG